MAKRRRLKSDTGELLLILGVGALLYFLVYKPSTQTATSP